MSRRAIAALREVDLFRRAIRLGQVEYYVTPGQSREFLKPRGTEAGAKNKSNAAETAVTQNIKSYHMKKGGGVTDTFL